MRPARHAACASSHAASQARRGAATRVGRQGRARSPRPMGQPICDFHRRDPQVRFTSTPVIFGTEPIVRFSVLGRQRSISGSTRGRLNPDPLNTPINTPDRDSAPSSAGIQSHAANPGLMLVFPVVSVEKN